MGKIEFNRFPDPNDVMAREKASMVVMIPAYNEESTIRSVIESIPKTIPGIGKIRVVVINDGSTDGTVAEALAAKAIVISNPSNRGLAYTFARGMEYALEMGADIIVNTDGDNQYDQGEIPQLVNPILQGKADMVLGSRFKGRIEHMPISKRWGNQFASWVLKQITGLEITDGQTGFRAFTREAALQLNVMSRFTYTQETLLDAADKGLRIIEIPSVFRRRDGKSRLFNGVLDYAGRALHTIIIGNLKLHPMTTFGSAGIALALAGGLVGLPVFENLALTGSIGPDYLMRAIVTGILFIIGIEIAALGLIAALIKHNRQLLEKQLYFLKKSSFKSRD